MSSIFSSTEIYLLIAIAVLLVLVIVLAVTVGRLGRKIRALDARLSRFMKGPDGASLEDAIIKMFEEHDVLMKDMQQDRADIDDLYERIRPMIQKVGVVKYDAFQQMGGSLSSAIVMLNEEKRDIPTLNSARRNRRRTTRPCSLEKPSPRLPILCMQKMVTGRPGLQRQAERPSSRSEKDNSFAQKRRKE